MINEKLIEKFGQEYLSSSLLVSEFESLKKQVNKARPISPEVLKRIEQIIRIEFNYNSNAIENNSLSLSETKAFIMHGVTAEGKLYRDFMDVDGLNKAFNYVLEFIKDENRAFNEFELRSLHKLILGNDPYTITAQDVNGNTTSRVITPGRYKQQPNCVETQTGEIYNYVDPLDVPARMQTLFDWYHKTSVHPVIVASVFHHEFTEIHPFDDGNGRLARLISNLILLKNKLAHTIIKKEDKGKYILALSKVDTDNDYTDLTDLFFSECTNIFKLYIQAINGEPLQDSSSLEKKIWMLERKIESQNDGVVYRDSDVLKNLKNKNLVPIHTSLSSSLDKFNPLFEQIKKSYTGLAFRKEKILKYDPSKVFNDRCIWEFLNYKGSDRTINIRLTLTFVAEDREYHIRINLVSFSGGVMKNLLTESILSSNYSKIINDSNEVDKLSDKIAHVTLSEMEKFNTA